MSRCSTLHQTSEVQVTECFRNLLFSIRTHFAVDSALLKEFSFPKPPFIVAAHIICKRVSHRSCTTVTVISRLQFSIQSLGHCGCTSARETERVAPRACTVLPCGPSARRSAQRARTHARHSARTHARTRRSARTHAAARAPLSARERAPLRTRARVPLRTHARRSARTRAASRARAPLRAHASARTR